MVGAACCGAEADEPATGREPISVTADSDTAPSARCCAPSDTALLTVGTVDVSRLVTTARPVGPLRRVSPSASTASTPVTVQGTPARAEDACCTPTEQETCCEPSGQGVLLRRVPRGELRLPVSVGVREGARQVQAERGLYYGWVLVLTLGVTTIISYGTTYYLFGVLVVPVSHDVGWSRASLSGAYALGTVLAGLLGVPIGRVVDRHGGRALMAAGSALTGLMLLGLAHVHALWQFYVLWVGGFALASGLTFYTVTFVVVANWFERRRGATLALLTLLGGLASPIFIPLAGTLIPRLGWRDTLMVLAVVQFGVALPLHALVVRRHPEDLGLRPDGADRGSPPASSPTTGLPLGRALRRTAFWTLTAAYALAMLASTVLLVHSVAYLIGRGYDAVLAADIVGLVGLASLPGRFILNMLSDRVGPQRLLGLCLVAQAVGVALLLHGTTLGWLAAYVLVYGAAFGAIFPLRASVMADHFGRQAFGATTAVQGVPIALAGGVGPLAAGWLYDRVGNYGLAFWLCAGAFLLAGLGVLLTPQPPHDAHPSTTTTV